MAGGLTGTLLMTATDDQRLLVETAARFLDERAPMAELRRRRDDPVGFDAAFWRDAAQLGWTSLLVDEHLGGSSVHGQGLLDLALVVHEVGRRGAPGPLAAANLAAAALSAHPEHAGARVVLDRLLAGEAVVTAAVAGPGPAPTLSVAVDGDQLVVDGTLPAVESAGIATHLVVAGSGPLGVTHVLLPLAEPGVTVRPCHTIDLTRRVASVRCSAVRLPVSAALGEPGSAARAVAEQWTLAVLLAAAEATGAMRAAFDLAIDWVFDRYSFGRPLASYQAIKHRSADMATALEAASAATEAALVAAAADPSTAEAPVAAAAAYAGHAGSELIHEAVQLHGGIGVTFDHDIHVHLRRHTLLRGLYLDPSAHRRRLGATALADAEHAGVAR